MPSDLGRDATEKRVKVVDAYCRDFPAAAIEFVVVDCTLYRLELVVGSELSLDRKNVTGSPALGWSRKYRHWLEVGFECIGDVTWTPAERRDGGQAADGNECNTGIKKLRSDFGRREAQPKRATKNKEW